MERVWAACQHNLGHINIVARATSNTMFCHFVNGLSFSWARKCGLHYISFLKKGKLSKWNKHKHSESAFRRAKVIQDPVCNLRIVAYSFLLDFSQDLFQITIRRNLFCLHSKICLLSVKRLYFSYFFMNEMTKKSLNTTSFFQRKSRLKTLETAENIWKLLRLVFTKHSFT